MLNNSLFWLMSRSLVLAVWIGLIAAALTLPKELAFPARIALPVLCLIHLAELPLSFGSGRENKLSLLRIVLKTLVFGFTWWIPLRKGVIHE